VLLTCEPSDREPLYKTTPCLIAEVISPSTEVIDRRDKLLAYRALETLVYYLLVSQDRRLVEVYQRDAEGSWRYEVREVGDLAFACGGLDIRFTLDNVYEDVTLS
jgi:Uma2 family endonuclease